MNSRFQQPSLVTVDRVTIVEPAAEDGARPKVCCPNREIANASGLHLTQETQALLRLRLRAAAFILLVGFGARLSGGCTSGHGVCGIARLSWRSIAATRSMRWPRRRVVTR